MWSISQPRPKHLLRLSSSNPTRITAQQFRFRQNTRTTGRLFRTCTVLKTLQSPFSELPRSLLGELSRTSQERGINSYTYSMEQEGFTCVICGDWIDDPCTSICNTAEHEALGLLWFWEEANRKPSSEPKKPSSPPSPHTLSEGDKSIPILLNGSKDITLPSSSPTRSWCSSEQVRIFSSSDDATQLTNDPGPGYYGYTCYPPNRGKWKE